MYLIIHKDLRIVEQAHSPTPEQLELLKNKEIRVFRFVPVTSYCPPSGQEGGYSRTDVYLYEYDHLNRSWMFYDIEERDRQLAEEMVKS